MNKHLPAHDEPSEHAPTTEEAPEAPTPTQLSGSQPMILSPQPDEESFFSFEEESPDLATTFVAPFQLSGALPPVAEPPTSQPSAAPTPPSTPPKKRRTRLSLTMIAILACVVVILGLFVMNALGQTTPPLQTRTQGSSQQEAQKSTGSQPQPTTKPSPAPPAAQAPEKNAQGQAAFEWVPQHLPNGWTNAGLQSGDGIQALRTAVAFTDREMSLDYRSVGTRNMHGGTFTAATFAMTPAARQRFQTNDIRASSNTLFDTVVTTRQIRLVVDPQPRLVTFAQADQQQFAWVDVAFQLWQSQIDPNAPERRIEGKERDPATKQPRVHHMMALLLRVPPQNAGTSPAMGGTGWLVSTYALDQPDTLNIVQPA